MSVDTEAAYDVLPGSDLRGKRKKQKRTICFFLIASLLAVLAALLVLPTIIVGGRARRAKVEIVGGTVQVRSDKVEVLNPKAHVLAERSLLQFMAVPYKAHLLPFTAVAYVNLPIGSSWSTKKLGEMEITKLAWDSSQTYNDTLEGNFKITAPIEDLAMVAREFFQKPLAKSTIKATVSMVSMLWGWIPMYFPYIYLEYEFAVPGMNNFETHPIQVATPSSVEGYPGHVEVGASAAIYYPSPIGVQLDTPLTVQVSFLFQGLSHTIGFAKLHPLRIDPGLNNITGNVSIIQTASNAGALEELFSLYVAEHDQTKSDPRIFINIHDAGNDTSSSELLPKAFQLIQLRVGFLAPKLNLVESASADFVFIGSLISSNPSFYDVTLHLKMSSPIPQQAAFTGMHVKAYQDGLSGEKIYDVTRDLDPDQFSVPSLAEHHYLSLPLHISEVHLALSISNFLWMCRSGAEAHTNMGFVVQANISVSPGGFTQTVRYTRNRIGVSMCYHMAKPTLVCGEHVHKGLHNTSKHEIQLLL